MSDFIEETCRRKCFSRSCFHRWFHADKNMNILVRAAGFMAAECDSGNWWDLCGDPAAWLVGRMWHAVACCGRWTGVWLLDIVWYCWVVYGIVWCCIVLYDAYLILFINIVKDYQILSLYLSTWAIHNFEDQEYWKSQNIFPGVESC